jgi:methylisocitrate lyase
VYHAIRRDGHQKSVIAIMQTREELYDCLGYHEFEQKLDTMFSARK